MPVAQLEAFRTRWQPGQTQHGYPLPLAGQRRYGLPFIDAASAEAGGKPWLNPYAGCSSGGGRPAGGASRQMALPMQYLQGCSSKGGQPKQELGVTGARPRDEQLAADIAARRTQFEGSLTLWAGPTLVQLPTAPAAWRTGGTAGDAAAAGPLLPADSGLTPGPGRALGPTAWQQHKGRSM